MLAANVAAHAQRIPDEPAYVTADSTVTWRDYHQRSDATCRRAPPPGRRVTSSLRVTTATELAFASAAGRAIDDPEAPTRQCWMP